MLYSPELDAAVPDVPRTRRNAKQPKRCPECGVCFTKTEHLARHIRSHTKEKPFSCRECGKSYSRQDSLLRHSRAHTRRPTNRSTRSVTPSSAQFSLAGESIQAGMTPQGEHDAVSQNSLSSSSFSHPTTASATNGWGAQAEEPSQKLTDSPLQQHALQSTIGTVSSGQYVGAAFPGVPAGVFNTPTDMELLDIGLNAHEPAWLLGSDFDLNTLDFPISTVMSEWGYPNQEPLPSQHETYGASNTLSRCKGHMSLSDLVPAVQYNWYTTLTRDVVCHESLKQQQGQDEIDEAYREGLRHKLQSNPSTTALPSADFLNLCIKLYFVRFNPVFPFIHAPSFRPSAENALLLLSVCSVGALFMGSAAAATQGRKIFQTLNKANLSLWDTYIRRDAREWRSLVQASIIGQTFGMLSGQPDNVCMTESFHGTVIAWARQGGFFKIKHAPLPSTGDPETSKEDIWRRWVDAEESVRLVLALYVHDSEFATTFHHEPLLRHTIEKLPVCNSDELFFASTAADWYSIVEKERATSSETAHVDTINSLAVPPVPTSNKAQLFAYASLAGIVASIQEERSSSLDDTSKHHFRNVLLAWHREHYNHIQGAKKNHINLLIFWHAAFMSLYADSDLLERSIGRDGRQAAQEARGNVNNWAASLEARRGVLHALLILKDLEMLPIGLEPAIHVPKAAFYSALVVYSYIKFKPSVDLYVPSQDEMNIPELRVPCSTSNLHLASDKASPAILSPVEPSILCNAIDLLRRIGHWEISRKFASILQILLDDLTAA
ncbi:fungal-specific transcription factor domain-containing protein [Xylaria sp. FL0933]|nr:fungal-specific transcription factor domain-containing protein [Xylaria sp. FL0933]